MAAAGIIGALVAGYALSASAPSGPVADSIQGAVEVVDSSALQVESAAHTSAVQAAVTGTPKVTVIGTGGTIAGVAPTRSSFTSYRAGQIPIASMVSQFRPEIGAVADVWTVQFGNSGSGGYRIDQFSPLTAAVEAALATSDGAASQTTYCFGTVLMLNDEFHAARDVTESSTTRMDTFQTRELGVLGWIDGPQIKVGRAPARVETCDNPQRWATPFDLNTIAPTDLPRLEVVYTYSRPVERGSPRSRRRVSRASSPPGPVRVVSPAPHHRLAGADGQDGR